ncbi:MAG: DEAD/DEAH box helicase [Planctomycetes bacterium]|nr:DEAD/DEAH box helicase [Planctomycetota bacterium]
MATGDAIAGTVERLDPARPLRGLPGIGPASAQRLATAGLVTVLDLVQFFPRRYRAVQELAAPDDRAIGELVRLCGTLRAARRVFLPGRRSMVTFEFEVDGGGVFAVPFFNQPWLARGQQVGERRYVEGVLAKKGRRFVLQAGKLLPRGAVPTGEVQLRYPEIDGIAAVRLQQWLAFVLAHVDWSRVPGIRLPAGLEEFAQAPAELLLAMHRPESVDVHERARRHFAVREAVAVFAAVERAARARRQRACRVFPVDPVLRERIEARIPLAWTEDQRGAIEALWQRLAGPAAMGVLLQGDVGTGKTAVAIAAALAVLAKGAVVAFLAPTELLAEQHHATVSAWLRGSGVPVVLHTAGTRQTNWPATGPLLVFGTHALLTSDLTLPRLGLVVVDEQHRFGVQQRMALVQKGDNPHVLVMTATPIPRTLALVVFGDLDVVTLAQRPPGRRPVRAFHVPTERWARTVQSIARAVARGGRVFVVCPAVGEDGEKGSVMRVLAALQDRFRCGFVHGRLSTAERQRVLGSFRAGLVDVLVGTTVLEVGVDVPDATLVVVVAADRFGIATLHQLRGRVGRGARRGLCLLCGPRTARVEAVCRSTDGFVLAEADLALRGSGELLGTAQSGFGDLRALDPVEDVELLLRVRKAVQASPVPLLEEERP